MRRQNRAEIVPTVVSPPPSTRLWTRARGTQRETWRRVAGAVMVEVRATPLRGMFTLRATRHEEGKVTVMALGRPFFSLPSALAHAERYFA